MRIRIMTMDDYDAVIGLMQATDGITVRDADSRPSIAAYLQRNPGLSFVAEDNETRGQSPGGSFVGESLLAGCILAGHDGRRGYLNHLIVRPAHRRSGIATALVEHCLAGLEREGIQKFHVDVLRGNDLAGRFWNRLGWQRRDDIDRYSFTRSASGNA